MTRRTLWRHPDFLKLWAGQTISAFGSMVSGLAVGFTAVLFLHSSPAQMGPLNAARELPVMLAGLAIGAWVDRIRRRPAMIAADLGRAMLLLVVPVLAWVHRLRIEHLLVIVFLTGGLGILFDSAYRAYLPDLVDRDQLVEGNSKLSATASISEMAGFSLGGMLVQWLSAPVALLVDALSFLCSGLSLAFIRRAEAPPRSVEEREPFWQEVREGLRVVAAHPALRGFALVAVLTGFGGAVISASLLLYLTEVLHLKPALQGWLFSIGGVTSMLGALAAARVSRRFGLGRTLAGSLWMSGVGTLCLALSAGPFALIVTLQALNQCITDPSYSIYEVTQMSLRQAITPGRLLGRVHASIEFLGRSTFLVGSLLAGPAALLVGLRGMLFVGCLPGFVGAAILALSPVWGWKSEAEAPLAAA